MIEVCFIYVNVYDVVFEQDIGIDVFLYRRHFMVHEDLLAVEIACKARTR
jgi:hypothetical protein